MGVPRLRRKVTTVPANYVPASRTYRITYPTGVVSESQVYLPKYEKLKASIFDENHKDCYPLCGGPMTLVKVIQEPGHMNLLHGWDKSDYYGRRNVSLTTGGFVLPWDNFSSEPRAAEIRNTSVHTATSPRNGLFYVPSDGIALGGAAFTKFRPRLEKLNLIESLTETRSSLALFSPGLDFVKSKLPWYKSTSKRYSKLAKKYGDSFVYANFGWVPFVRDLYAYADLVINSEAYVDKLVKDNGKWTSRQGTVLVDDQSYSTKYDTNTAVKNLYSPNNIGSFQSAVHTVNSSRKVRFSGEFRYYIPGIDRSTFTGRFSALTVLSGLRLTPSNVYHAMPWSWLVDWHTGVGQWVDNYSSTHADDCAARFCWLSEQLSVMSQLSVNLKTWVEYNSQNYVYGSASGSSRFILQRKTRWGNSQPSFSFGGGQLSDKQALILHSIIRGRV